MPTVLCYNSSSYDPCEGVRVIIVNGEMIKVER